MDRYIYSEIFCNGCYCNPNGSLLKCLLCPDFILCEKCFDQSVHSHHVFGLVRSKEQNRNLKMQLLFGTTWKPYFENHEKSQDLRNLPPFCCICAIRDMGPRDCSYICLDCRPLYGLCKNCWQSKQNNHPKNHFFAITKSGGARQFVTKALSGEKN